MIDGKEIRNPWTSSVGQGPIGGYHVLNPGAYYELGLSLDHTQFSVGDHKLSWIYRHITHNVSLRWRIVLRVRDG